MNKRVIAVGGVPGTGKTTLMKSFLGEIVPELKQFRKLVTGHEFDDYIVLGDYSDKEAVFSGSDKFSMAVQPEAETFFDETEKNVVYEGDRIFNGKMLEYINKLGYKLLIIILETDSKKLQERYDARGSEQSEKFINGRKTKYENIKNNGVIPVYTAIHESLNDTNKLTMAMHDFINNGIIDTNVLTEVKNDSLSDFFN